MPKRLELYRRCDRSELSAGRKTDEGFLILDAFVAKPGILTYINPDGTKTLELLTEEALHADEGIQTLMRKPVTLGHPSRNVGPDNVKQHRVGSVGETTERCDDGRLKVSITVERSDAIKAVEDGTHQLSPGYTVVIDPTPGIHPIFGRYDAIQVSRRYNHLAIVDRARGGPSIHLRSDEAYCTPGRKKIQLGAPMLKFLALLVAAGMKREDAEPVAAQCEVESDQRVIAATATLKTDNQTVSGERDALQVKLDSRSDEEPFKARLDWFSERNGMLAFADACKIGDDVKDLSNDEIGVKVVHKLDGSSGDLTPEYVRAYLKVHKDAASKARPAGSMYGKRSDAEEEEGKPAFLNKEEDKTKKAVDAHYDAIEEARRKNLEVPK